MVDVAYQIVEHDGGWAYKYDGSFSETFPSRASALAAARRAAAEQQLPGETTDIEWEDEHGKWRRERADGADRPSTDIVE